jgi:hypothetical protein
MDLARAHMETQMPKELAGMRSVKPQTGDFIGVTDMWNNVGYNPIPLSQWSGGDQSKVDDVLAHELTHVGQSQRRGGLFKTLAKRLYEVSTKDYMDQDTEKEAFATMARREARRKDYNLAGK